MLTRVTKLALLASLVLILSALIWATMLTGPRVKVTLAVPWIAVVGVIIMLLFVGAAGARSRRSWAVLNGLEQAVRLNMPLPGAIRAIGETENLRTNRLLKRAARALEDGTPVAVVLEQVPGTPLRIIAMIEAAERVGRLPQMLSQLVRQRRMGILKGLQTSFFTRIYPLILSVLIIGIAGLFMVFVMPKFQAIFRDFNVRLPFATEMLLRVAHASGLWLLLLAIILFCLLLTNIGTVWKSALSRGLVETPMEWIANHLPWIGTMRLNHDLGIAFTFAADSIDAGQSLVETLYEAAGITPNSRLRSRILKCVEHMQQGRTFADAVRAAEMPNLVCGMIATAQQSSDLPPILRFLGSYYANRFSRAMVMLEAAVLPSLAIVAGAVVAWLALSIMLPIMRLIDECAKFPTGV